jgi:hypothetical protein
MEVEISRQMSLGIKSQGAFTSLSSTENATRTAVMVRELEAQLMNRNPAVALSHTLLLEQRQKQRHKLIDEKLRSRSLLCRAAARKAAGRANESLSALLRQVSQKALTVSREIALMDCQ